MSQLDIITAGRIALLARAAWEGCRYEAHDRAGMETLCSQQIDKIDRADRKNMQREIERYLSGPAAPAASAGGLRLAGGEETPSSELLRKRASLELQIQTELDKRKEIERALGKEQTEHREALETLSLQQRKIKELQDERGKLLSEVGALESKLRLELNATEQAELKYQKLLASRQTMGEQATELIEQLNALKAENDKLLLELESVKKQRDREVAGEAGRADAALEATAEAAFQRLWAKMRAEIPEVFVETIVPNENTFENLGEAFVEFLRVMATMERHVHQLLRDLRQVSEKTDKLNHFYIMLTKNANLVETLKDFLASGKRKGNFVNLLRALQAWTRAFASGAYKVIVRSPVTIADEMSYKAWPLKTGFTKTEDAAIGEYYKQTAIKTIPEKLGTAFRKQAADMAYEDYNELMKRK